VGANLSNKKDNTFYQRNQKNNSFMGSLTTVYNFPLQTTLSFNSNLTENTQVGTIPLSALMTTQFKLTALSLNAQYRLLGDRLRLASTVSTTTGDLYRTLIQAGIDYSINDYHGFVLQGDYIQNSGTKDDKIISLIYRYSL